MPFKKGHTHWKHPNVVKTQFKKGEPSRFKGIRKPCPHGNYGFWFCETCQRPRKKIWADKNKEKTNAKSREKYKEMKKDPEAMEKLRAYYREWAKTPTGVLKYYRRNAKDRGIDFEITKETIEKYWEDDCYYCEESKRRGLDRVDNTKGYTEDNVVPCCEMCNWMKRDMTQKDFISKCWLIGQEKN